MHRIISAATETRTPIVTSWFSAPPPPTCGATGRRSCNTPCSSGRSFSATRASATRACASNWPSSFTTTTPAPSRAGRAESRSTIMDDGKTPERPRVEPEIIPPDRTRSARRDPSYVETGGTHRVYVTRIGPLGGVLLLLVIAVFVAAGGLLLFGALLIWLPLV